MCLSLRAKCRRGRRGARDENRVWGAVGEVYSNVPGAYNAVTASGVTVVSGVSVANDSPGKVINGQRTDRIPCLSTARLLTPRR